MFCCNVVVFCPQIGPGGDELNPNTKVPRMLGYRGLCDEGSVVGDEEVEKLDTDDEQFLENSKGRRLVASRKDEKDVDKMMERFFDDFADKDALEKVNRGCKPSGKEHARKCLQPGTSDQPAEAGTSDQSAQVGTSNQCPEGKTPVTLSQPEAATGDSSKTMHDKPISLSEWQAQHGIPPADVDAKKVDDIDVDVDIPTVDEHYCYGDGDSDNDDTEVCME